MLDLAIKYKDRLIELQRSIWLDDKYKYWNCNCYYDSLKVDETTWGRHQFVSVKDGEVISATLGYIAYSYSNYVLVPNLVFAVDFCNSLADFAYNESYMKNKNKLSFQDFVYRKFGCEKEKSML